MKFTGQMALFNQSLPFAKRKGVIFFFGSYPFVWLIFNEKTLRNTLPFVRLHTFQVCALTRMRVFLAF